jgi:hypothetical protein
MLAKVGDRKYVDQVVAGLIDDPEALEQDRQRRSATQRPPVRTDRRVARREPRWLPIGGER